LAVDDVNLSGVSIIVNDHFRNAIIVDVTHQRRFSGINELGAPHQLRIIRLS